MIEIKFPKTNFDTLGRSGYTQSHGISICNLRPEVFLEPITSRGEIGTARLVLPITHVAALRDALTGILAEPETIAAVGPDRPDGFGACRLLVAAYARGEAAGGSVDWSDVDAAHAAARKALGLVEG